MIDFLLYSISTSDNSQIIFSARRSDSFVDFLNPKALRSFALLSMSSSVCEPQYKLCLDLRRILISLQKPSIIIILTINCNAMILKKSVCYVGGP
jgi:hypothetical protein